MSDFILEVADLSVAFDGVKVLQDLSFQLRYGELRFLIGPNGAGKTTFLDVLTGKVRPNRGRVIFDGGVDVLRLGVHELARRGVGRKFQAPTIFPSLTVRENLEVAARGKGHPLRLVMPGKRDQSHRVSEVLDTIDLTNRAWTLAGTLSHGEKQWLEIGILLVGEPRLLLLDEPVAGMTRGERERTGRLLAEIARDRTVLVVEHDMHFVRQFSSTVTVLHGGGVLTEGPMTQVQADERVIDVYLGRKRPPVKTAPAPDAPRAQSALE